MSNAKHAPMRKRGAKALPVLGAAGLLSLAGGAASAATNVAPVADLPTQKTAPNHEIILGEEELSDVSLSTFYVLDREGSGPSLSSATSSPGGDAAVVGVVAVAAAAAAGAAGAAAAVAAAAVAAASHGDGAASANGHTSFKSEHNKSPSQHCATGRGPTVLAVPTERATSIRPNA